MILEKILGSNFVSKNLDISGRNFTKIETEVNSIGEQINTLVTQDKKWAKFAKTTNQSIANLTNSQIIWEVKTSYNGESFCEIDSATKRVKILESGIYELALSVEFDANGNGLRGIILQDVLSQINAFNSYSFYYNLFNFAEISAGVLLGVSVNQSSGGSLNLNYANTILKIRQVAKL